MRKFSSLVNLVEDEIYSAVEFDSRVDSIILEEYDKTMMDAFNRGVSTLRSLNGNIDNADAFRNAIITVLSNTQSKDGNRVFTDDTAIANVAETFLSFRESNEPNYKPAINNILFKADSKISIENLKYFYDQCVNSGGPIKDTVLFSKYIRAASYPGFNLNKSGLDTPAPQSVLEQIRNGTEAERFPGPNAQKVFLRYILPFGIRTATSLVTCGGSGYSAFRGAYPTNTAELEDLVRNAINGSINASIVARNKKSIVISKTRIQEIVDPKWSPEMDTLGPDEEIPEEPVPESRAFDALIRDVLLNEDIAGSVGGVPTPSAPAPSTAPTAATPSSGGGSPTTPDGATDGGGSPSHESVEMEEAKVINVNAEQTKQAFLWMRLVSKQNRGDGYFENPQVLNAFLDEDEKEFKKYYQQMSDNEMLCEYLAARLGTDEEKVIDALNDIRDNGYVDILGGDPLKEIELSKYDFYVSTQYFPVDGPLQRFAGAKKFSHYLYADPESEELYYALNTYPPSSSRWFQTPSVKPMIIMSDRTLPFGRRLGAFLGKSKPQTSQNSHGGRVIKGF